MFNKITDAIKSGRSPYLFTAIDGPEIGQIAVSDDHAVYGNENLVRDCSGIDLPCVLDHVLVERITTPPHLVLCGAGHVSICTAKIAKMVGFRVTVIDDRTDFANHDRFPDADEIINRPFREAINDIVDTNTYYVIVTRGHKDDRVCLETILEKPYAYCGMIGSKGKVDILFSALREKGVSEEVLSRIHSPIGLKIGAETPEEIALCIAAEMILVKNGCRHGSEWDESLILAIDTLSEPYAMVTLISKHGSAPRSTGARMIVKSDGTIVSSIGGGFGEFEASQYAREMLLHGPGVKRYTCKMNNTDAASKGMICGGVIDILIQISEGKHDRRH